MADDIRLTKLADCAGCGAKVGAGTLAELLSGIRVQPDPDLLVGFDRSDDAAVYRVTDDVAIVQTLDFFPPVADDPYTFGAIAAANALSDIYAMGGEPKTALNILAVPESMPKEAVHEILRGGYDKVYEAGAVIAGGHSIHDDTPKYGLSVTGFVHPKKLLRNDTVRPGDVLILTKPLGTGVLTAAAKADLAGPESLRAAFESMKTLNKYARDIAVGFPISACTDVTGFGLLGHLYEMAHGSGVTVAVDSAAFRFLPEAEALAKDGILPAGMYRNRHYAQSAVEAGSVPLWLQDLLYDPQTSGGLLLACPADCADALCRALEGHAPAVQRFGIAEEKKNCCIFLR